MDLGEDDLPADGTSAAEAFSLLGNETRIGILRALWELEGPCSFAELRRAVDPDDPGNFNYHLGKLVGHFVRKTDDGYELRLAGERVVRAVIAGTLTADPSIPPERIDDRCIYCGGDVEMAYEDELISVRCTGCGGVAGGEYPDGTCVHFEFPPGGLAGRTREEAVDGAHVFYDARLAPMMKGTCPECAGRVDLSFEVCDDHDPGESGLCPNCDGRFEVWSIYECERCKYSRRAVVWFAALNHPAVVSFFHEHGLDETIPFRKLTWENARYVRDITGTVVERDPYRFRVTIPVGGETLTMTLDETLDVLSIDRERDGDG